MVSWCPYSVGEIRMERRRMSDERSGSASLMVETLIVSSIQLFEGEEGHRRR